ncbi:MAG: NFACT family protein [Candidatus Lokiarchaeota archaeon]|nr:NFACT family protein [Candidatus Lokiarchaeota archaeon]
MSKIKTYFSNIDVSAIVRELDQSLTMGRIINVYEIEELLILKINTIEGNKNLIIKKDARINLTEYNYPKPKYPSQYIISLRKFLKNKKITKIYQYNFDRILVIEYIVEDKIWKFIIELFNKGNYIIIDNESIIRVAKRYLKYRDRSILAKKEYFFPKSFGINFMEINKDEFLRILNKESQIVKIFAKEISVSGIYSEEICFRANIDKEIMGNQLTNDQIDSLFNAFKNLRNDLLFKDIRAHIIYDNKNLELSVLPFELLIYKNYEKKDFPTFNEAVDFYFSKIDSKTIIKGSDSQINNKIKSQKKILNNQTEYIEQLGLKIKKYYDQGDFIYANMDSLEKLLDVIKIARNKKYAWEDINNKLIQAKENSMNEALFFKKIIPSTQEIVLEYHNGEIYIDSKKTIGENANLLYQKGKKLKKKKKGTEEAIEKTNNTLKKLEREKEHYEEEIDFLVKKPEKKWFEKYHWFKSSTNFLIIGGRDASSNELIFRKHIDPNDLVFHTIFPGSPLVIIKNPDKKIISEETIKEVSIFVVSYSQAWKENWGYADIFYVNPEQISKTPPSGEFLPKGSFMIEGKKNIIKSVKTELAIGLLLDEMDGDEYEKIYYPKIISGPINAIKNQTDNYLIISPSKSGETKGKIAKKIKNFFIDRGKEKRKWIKFLSLDDIILVLPNGSSKINYSN